MTGCLPAFCQANPVLSWNRALLEVLVTEPSEPTVAAWRLHVVSTAMYDAWASLDPVALPTRPNLGVRQSGFSPIATAQLEAVHYAAHRSLTALLPRHRRIFDRLLAETGLPPSHDIQPSTAAGLGNACADAVIDDRFNDGSNASIGFIEIPSLKYPACYRPGERGDDWGWVPLEVPNGRLLGEHRRPILNLSDPRTFTRQRFVTPHWGSVTPFAIPSSELLRPPPPPRRNSQQTYRDALGHSMSEDEAWNHQVDEMVKLSSNLSDRDKASIEYWAEGPGGWTPPVHWNQFARGVALRDGHDLGTSIRLFFALNAAMLDASIACWDAKRAFDYHRPCTAVRLKYRDQTIEAWGGPDQGTQLIPGQDWQPYQRADYCTPAFPEYTSGHSTFSRAAREVLLGFTGSDALYDGRSRLDVDLDGDGELDWLGQWNLGAGRSRIERIPAQAVVLRWPTLLEAAEDAGYSRRLGGIHFQDGDLVGRQTGVQIGQQALRVTRDLWDGRRPGRQPKRGPGPPPSSAAIGNIEGPFALSPN